MSDIKCPYCMEIIEFSDYGQWHPSQDEAYEINCSSCNKKIVVEIHIKYEYEISKPNCIEYRNKNHEFEVTGYTIYTTDGISIADKKLFEKWPSNPPEKWKYWENLKCKTCDDTSIRYISKEEFYQLSGFIEEEVIKRWEQFKTTPSNTMKGLNI